MTALHRIKPVLRFSALALVVVSMVGNGAPSQAAGTHLCDGYRSCAAQGMGSGGYAAVNDRMYWRMYSGHNCTNYVAYRMIQSGMPNVRPWDGGGNATYWGRYMSRITDQTPRVGSVAWWQDGGPGHVAYVEKVVSSSEIIISQDSWGGDFSWARVTKAYRWPDGFIHFNDRRLANVSAPSFKGTPRVDADVTATAGSWRPTPTGVSYRWYVDGELLPRARKATVRLTPWMVGHPLTVQVTATRTGYPTRTVTASAGEIEPGSFTMASPPKVRGTAQVNRTLLAAAGSWSPQPATISYRWLLDGKQVSASPRFRVLPTHGGRTLSAVVTAKRRGYETVTRTVARARVALAVLTRTQPSEVEGQRLRGQVLRVHAGITAQRASRSVQWLRDGRAIGGATATAYRLTHADVGHVVSARVTHRKLGYSSVVEEVGQQPVKGVVRLNSTRRRAADGFAFTLRPTVAGQPLPDRTIVWVTRGSTVLARGPVTDGRVRLRVTDLPRGRRTVVIRVPATSISVAKVATRRPYFR